MTYSCLSVDIGTISEQDADDVRLICASCQMERSLAPNRRNIGFGSVLNQIDDDVHATHKRGNMQRSQTRLRHGETVNYDQILSFIGTYLCRRFDRSPVFQQQLHNFDPTLFARDVQGREAIQCTRVWIRFSIQKQFRDPHMTTVSSNVKCCQVVLHKHKHSDPRQ